VDGEEQVMVLLDFENGNLHSIRDDRILYAIVNRAEKTGQVEPDFASSSLVAFVAVVLAVAFALCVGLVFYYKRRSSSKEASANQTNPMELR
jgi:hypothetical protein